MSEVYRNHRLKECTLSSSLVYQNGFGEIHIGTASSVKYEGKFLMVRFYPIDLRVYTDDVWGWLKDDADRDAWMWDTIMDYLKPDMIQDAITDSYNEGRAHGREELRIEIRALLGA